MALKICFLSVLHTYDDTRVFVKEARSLAKVGFEVTHLAAGNIQSQVIDDVKIDIYSSITRNGLVGRLVKPFQLFARALEIKPDCYHCNEIESWIVGCMIKILRPKTRIIFDVHEHYPSFFENPFYPRWVRWIGHPLTIALYRLLTPLTDYIVLILPSLAKDFKKSKDKIIVVANYTSVQFSNLQREEVDINILSQFQTGKTAIHIGSIARSRGWPQLLQALAKMEYVDLKVLFLGDIPNKDEILDQAHRLGVSERVLIHTKVPYEQMMEFLICSDIGLILYLPDMQNHVLAWPTKLCDYMMARLPVIAPVTMELVAEAIKLDRSGLLVDPSNPDQIAQALDRLCLDEKGAFEMGERGYRAVNGKYNWEAESMKLVDMYLRIEEEVRSK